MYSEILILALLRQKPQHGYELRKNVEQVLGGTVALNNTVLYPALKRFAKMGAVVRQVVQQEGKPNRHLYRLTERGNQLLHTYLCDFPPAQAASEAEFLTRVAFFDYLEPQEQREILKKRMAYLQGSLEHLLNLQQMAGEACATATQRRVLELRIQQIRGEYQWIAAWLDEPQADS